MDWRILILGWVILIGSGGEFAFSQTPHPGPTDSSSSPALPGRVPPADDLPNAQPPVSKLKKLNFELSPSVVYRKTDNYELTCDIYRPTGKGPFPAILAVHGGAWRNGTKLAMIRHAWVMASSGYVVVAINYRHAPQYPFPAQIDDCKHAVRWIKANSKEYGIDPDRIGAFGYSAGGHLVALLGTTDEKDGLEGTIEPGLENLSTRVNAVAAGAAPCEFDWIGKESPLLTYWLGGSPLEKPDSYRIAAPTTYISADDPPFYFFHGDSDLVVPVSSTLKMHRLLMESDVPSEHSIARGGGHVTTFSDIGWMNKAIQFFDSHLKQ